MMVVSVKLCVCVCVCLFLCVKYKLTPDDVSSNHQQTFLSRKFTLRPLMMFGLMSGHPSTVQKRTKELTPEDVLAYAVEIVQTLSEEITTTHFPSLTVHNIHGEGWGLYIIDGTDIIFVGKATQTVAIADPTNKPTRSWFRRV